MPFLKGALQILLCGIGHLKCNSLFVKTEPPNMKFVFAKKITGVKLYVLPFIVYCPYLAFFGSFSNLSGSFINLLAYLVIVIVSTPPQYQVREAHMGC